jgi:Superinfection immunity protein
MQALADSGAFWALLILMLGVIYLLPAIIAVIRGVDQLALVVLVNFIGGLSGIGWLAALILAFGPRRVPPAPPAVPHAMGGRARLPGPDEDA